MIQGENQTATARGAGIEIVRMPAELDLTTSEGAVEQGCAAMARPVRLLLLDLTGLSFCDARGLSAFVRIANHADAAGCGFGLIAPRPPVRKILRISGLDSRMPVFATVDDAWALLMAMAAVLGDGMSRSRHPEPMAVACPGTGHLQRRLPAVRRRRKETPSLLSPNCHPAGA